MGVAGINRGEWGLSDIGWGLSELVDIKGGSRNEFVEGSVGWQILSNLREVKGIHRNYQESEDIEGVEGIKSILWILSILKGVYGVMEPYNSNF